MENVNKTKIADLETNKNVQGLEEMMTEAEGGYDLETAELVKQALDRVNGVSEKIDTAEKISEATEKRVEDLGGSKEIVEERLGENTAKMEELKEDTQEKVKEVDGVENNESEEAKQNKQKKFEQFEQWFKNDFEKEQENPDKLVNKISKSAKEYKDVLNEQMSSLGYRSFNQNLKEKFNTTPQELEATLPDLYKKGLISKEKYAYYIMHESLNGNNLNILKLNSLVENASPDILEELQNNDQNLTSMLGSWHTSISNEIKKELNNKVPSNSGQEIFREPEKLLSLVSNAARFENKESIQEIVDKVVDEYLTSGSNLYRLKSNTGDTYPVLKNLCEAGFTDQAIKIMEKSLGKGMPTRPIFELKEKGFLSEEQAKGIFDRAGKLD